MIRIIENVNDDKMNTITEIADKYNLKYDKNENTINNFKFSVGGLSNGTYGTCVSYRTKPGMSKPQLQIGKIIQDTINEIDDTIEELNIAKQFAKEILPIINDQD